MCLTTGARYDFPAVPDILRFLSEELYTLGTLNFF